MLELSLGLKCIQSGLEIYEALNSVLKFIRKSFYHKPCCCIMMHIQAVLYLSIYVYERSRSKPSCFCRVFLFCINASRRCIAVYSRSDLPDMYVCIYLPNFTFKVYVQAEISQSLSSRECVFAVLVQLLKRNKMAFPQIYTQKRLDTLHIMHTRCEEYIGISFRCMLIVEVRGFGARIQLCCVFYKFELFMPTTQLCKADAVNSNAD